VLFLQDLAQVPFTSLRKSQALTRKPKASIRQHILPNIGKYRQKVAI